MTADLWVFAYGSLMWRPGFAYREMRRARLTGYHRAFCVCSVHHRGTPGRIGLVLGLDRGGVCEGVAYRIDAQDVPETRAYLRARELVNGVYREALRPVELETTGSEAGSAPSAPTLPSFPQRGRGRSDRETTVRTTALAYIVERAHPTYAGHLPPVIQARLIRAASGLSGTNLDYLISTVRHLKALGIRERGLERLVTLAGPLAWTEARAPHTSAYAASIVRSEQRRPPPLRLPARRSGSDFLFRLRQGP
ncbi:MAG TPA: gamma-glutamylcyclotransferase [Hyphomicrobiaceae bacterium]|nr:gamma-glutamylcyclotransferase [Hyphomicrobiaceae bacterium]